jgi:hypothetical protein
VDRTGPTGIVRFDGVWVGDVRVTAEHRSFESGSATAAVVLRGRAEIDVHLVRKASLEDRIARSRMSVDLEHRTLADVQWQIETATGITLRVDAALAAKAKDMKLAPALQDVPLRDVLDALCNAIGGAKYEIARSGEALQEENTVRIVPETR